MRTIKQWRLVFLMTACMGAVAVPAVALDGPARGGEPERVLDVALVAGEIDGIIDHVVMVAGAPAGARLNPGTLIGHLEAAYHSLSKGMRGRTATHLGHFADTVKADMRRGSLTVAGGRTLLAHLDAVRVHLEMVPIPPRGLVMAPAPARP